MSGATVTQVPDGFLVVCPQHNLIRGVETGQHAANLQALHNRKDHADDTDSTEVDLTAAAQAVLEEVDSRDTSSWAAALRIWKALTGLPGDEALEHVQAIAANPVHRIAAIPPF